MQKQGRTFAAVVAAALALTAASVAAAGPFKGASHGELSLTGKDGSTIAYTYDRGRITALGSGSITLAERGGRSITLAVDSSTVVREKGANVTLDSLQVGERAMFFSQGGKAVVIRCVTGGKKGEASSTATKAAKTKGPGLFKGAVHGELALTTKSGAVTISYDRGSITAVGGGSITVRRRDGASVTLATDSSTRVREKGEASSVDALKAGERAMVFSVAGKATLIRCVKAAKTK